MRTRLSKDFVLSCKNTLTYRVYKEYVKIKVRYFKSMFWVIILCNLETAWYFGGTHHLHLQGQTAGQAKKPAEGRKLVPCLAYSLTLKMEEIRSLQNIRFSANYVVLHPRRLYSSQPQSQKPQIQHNTFTFNSIRFQIFRPLCIPVLFIKQTKKKKTPWPLVRKRTIPTERPPYVGEVNANFFG
jgi:hypothetical protein